MILKIAQLKKILKEAADNQGLFIYNAGHELHLSGRYWIINISRHRMSNKALAAVIEIAGELPEKGEAFTVYTEEDNQLEMDLPERYVLEKFIDGQLLKETPIVFTDGRVRRILQDDVGNVVAIDEKIRELISIRGKDEDEAVPMGPMMTGAETDHKIYWQNENCTVAVIPHRYEDCWQQELLNKMREVKIG